MTALLALTSDRAIGPWLRGRMWMAGVRDRTPLRAALDVLAAVGADCPDDELRKRRQRLDMDLDVARAQAGRVDRDTWGLT